VCWKDNVVGEDDGHNDTVGEDVDVDGVVAGNSRRKWIRIIVQIIVRMYRRIAIL